MGFLQVNSSAVSCHSESSIDMPHLCSWTPSLVLVLPLELWVVSQELQHENWSSDNNNNKRIWRKQRLTREIKLLKKTTLPFINIFKEKIVQRNNSRKISRLEGHEFVLGNGPLNPQQTPLIHSTGNREDYMNFQRGEKRFHIKDLKSEWTQASQQLYWQLEDSAYLQNLEGKHFPTQNSTAVQTISCFENKDYSDMHFLNIFVSPFSEGCCRLCSTKTSKLRKRKR